jgi:hypothetical protein
VSNKGLFASHIKMMTYDELIGVANDLVAMQKDAKDDGWEWKPDEAYGEFGLANMLSSWAEAQDDDD